MEKNLPAERVAAEVRAAMGRTRYTQTLLADHIGMSQAALSRRLRGEVAFDINELSAIAACMNIALNELLPADRQHEPTEGRER